MCGTKNKQGGCCQKPEKLQDSSPQKCSPDKTEDCHGQEKKHSCCCNDGCAE